MNYCKFAKMAQGKKNILYVHGMGGGGDSRIPKLLSDYFSTNGDSLSVVVRTYDFDPEKGREEILSWVRELNPSVVVGESLGSIHAIRVRGIPHILVSPSLDAPKYLYKLAFLTKLPFVSSICGRIWHPKEGDRQKLDFSYDVLKKYKAHLEDAISAAKEGGRYFAFFGTRDHYRRSGVVRIRTWKKLFGDSYRIYDGTHFMEEEYVYSMLAPMIKRIASEDNNDYICKLKRI